MPGVTTPVAMPAPRSVRSVELTHKQIAGIILLACVPLPLLSLAAAVVPLPEMVERAAARFIPFAPPTLGDDPRRVAVTVPARARPAVPPRRRSELGNVAQLVQTPRAQLHSREPATHRSERTEKQKEPQQQPQQPAVAAAQPQPEAPAPATVAASQLRPEAPAPEPAALAPPSKVGAASAEATANATNGNAVGQTAEKRNVPDNKEETPGNQASTEPPGQSNPGNSGTGNHGQGNSAGNEEKPVGNGRP